MWNNAKLQERRHRNGNCEVTDYNASEVIKMKFARLLV